MGYSLAFEVNGMGRVVQGPNPGLRGLGFRV